LHFNRRRWSNDTLACTGFSASPAAIAMRSLLSLALLLCIAAHVRADVTLAPPFQDHAIVQRDKPLPVWGRAAPGEHVTVEFKGQRIGTTVGDDGCWLVYLEPVPASAEPAVLTVTGKNTLTVQDVLVGEVWLASGQSNMEWPVAKSADAEQEMATARFPLIREFDAANTVTDQPADTVAGMWQPCAPDTAGRFSAIAYFFARELHRKLGVPVGILNSTWGGTAIEAWTDAFTLKSTVTWPAIDARWQQSLAEFPERLANHPAELAAWKKADELAKATKTKNPLPWPRAPVGPGTPYALSGLFNGMIAPLQPYAMRGAIWYQGESNWPRPAEYAEVFPAMIRAWRAQWNQGDFPFYFVQLANFTVTNDPGGLAWAWLREAQMKALTLPNTGVAVTIDIGDPKDIHPRNKQEVGRRLALLAKAQVYDIPVDWSGPLFASARREGAAMRVSFTQAADGLTAGNKPLQAFELAGADRMFYPAAARIDRDTVVVSAPEVPAPEAVRYAWSNSPEANLFGGTGLPAAPFRSDAW
jgi:sialate O-acetylesterase